MDQWKVDYQDKYSFHNLITDLDMYCKSDFLVGLLGSSFVVGLGFMGFLLKLGDVYGRK